MLIGIWIPVIALWAGLLLAGTMLAYAFTLIVLARDPFKKAIPALVLFVLSLGISLYHIFKNNRKLLNFHFMRSSYYRFVIMLQIGDSPISA